IAITRRAAFAIGNVNQPSPQHRSTTFVPARRPTARNTSEGSGHSASHQPAAGISVPSKKPGSFAIAHLRTRLASQFGLACAGHYEFRLKLRPFWIGGHGTVP